MILLKIKISFLWSCSLLCIYRIKENYQQIINWTEWFEKRNDVQSIFFSQGILEKNLFVQTAELLFIITGDMNISAYGVPIIGQDGNGIGSPFNQLFKSESSVDIDTLLPCSAQAGWLRLGRRKGKPRLLCMWGWSRAETIRSMNPTGPVACNWCHSP